MMVMLKNMGKIFILVFLAGGLLVPLSVAQAKSLKVIATIKPLYSLVANVMGDTGQLDLMVSGGLNPHIYRLKPSNIRQIHNSDVVFYIDPNLEVFLKRIFKRKYNNFKAVPLAQAKGMHLIPYRTSKIWYQDAESPTKAQENSPQDLHIWLDPANARRMVRVIEETLSELDPANSLTYIRNAQKTIARLYRMEEDIREQLRPFRKKTMIVYHDAFQYFEKAFGLKSVGAIILKSDQTPSVKHIRALKRLARTKNVTCVLGAPGANPRIATVVMSDTDAGFSVVDPLGLYLDKSPDLYFDMMHEMAQSIVDCQDDDSLSEDLNALRNLPKKHNP
ncbi:Zinc ABC transporter, periplasmic-binding protein ZnuA [hydrothermal vent metagenome]|uniref:Zinc ABC transporter, periplasmic-binding protein ZnuA n=1 Tax=hydrothermal vent metagenome TaxID=652676 RepID=A0A3B0S2Y5_9ZZZZ